MQRKAPEKVSKCEILSWEIENYMKSYYPWTNGDLVNENCAEVHRDYTIVGVYGITDVDSDQAKAIYEAHKKSEYIFSIPFEDIPNAGVEAHEHKLEVGKGVFFEWPLAKAIASYFKNGKHLNYLDKYDVKRLNWVLVD
jgi:hypothetical protein